jgi:hypothetical protein
VVACAQTCGVRYFIFPSCSAQRTRVGVRECDCATLRRAFTMELSQTNLYIVDNQSKSAHWPTSRLAGLKLPEEDTHNLLLVYQPVTSPAGDGLPAEEYACQIDSWAIDGTNLNSQNANSVSSCIPSGMTASGTIGIFGERYPTIEETAWERRSILDRSSRPPKTCSGSYGQQLSRRRPATSIPTRYSPPATYVSDQLSV